MNRTVLTLKITLVVISLLAIAPKSHSQKVSGHFKDEKVTSDGRLCVYFDLEKIQGESQAGTLEAALEGVSGVESGTVFQSKAGQYCCKLVLSPNTEVALINSVVIQHGSAIAPSSMKAQITNKADVSEEQKDLSGNPAPHQPVFVDTGNPEADNAAYEQAKQEWIQNYPEEVEKVTGRSYKMATGIILPVPEKNEIPVE
jgi:hypothetical protein